MKRAHQSCRRLLQLVSQAQASRTPPVPGPVHRCLVHTQPPALRKVQNGFTTPSMPELVVRNKSSAEEASASEHESWDKVQKKLQGDFDSEDSPQEDEEESEEEIEGNAAEEMQLREQEKKPNVEDEMGDNSSKKERRKRAQTMAESLLRAALDEPDEEEEGNIPEDRQRSLRVGILGAANAGKSSLTNFMVGTKIAAVSRKRNTTLSEVLGIMTKGNLQMLFYDTPGLVLDILGHPSRTDTRDRSETAWQLLDHCDILVVLIDAYRQIEKPDRRVFRLVERLGKEEKPHPKRVLCLNKVDIVKKKSDLLPLAQQLGSLPGYESIFMISGLTGSGVRQLEEYLIDQAVLRPWEEEPNPLNEETLRTLSMEVVREHLLHHVHEEIPYELDQQLTGWEEFKDGSLRIEQHLHLPKKGQCKILVGKGGSKIRQIGEGACKELTKLLGRKVHLFLEVQHVSRY